MISQEWTKLSRDLYPGGKRNAWSLQIQGMFYITKISKFTSLLFSLINHFSIFDSVLSTWVWTTPEKQCQTHQTTATPALAGRLAKRVRCAMPKKHHQRAPKNHQVSILNTLTYIHSHDCTILIVYLILQAVQLHQQAKLPAMEETDSFQLGPQLTLNWDTTRYLLIFKIIDLFFYFEC